MPGVDRPGSAGWGSTTPTCVMPSTSRASLRRPASGRLNDREVEVLGLVAQGCSSAPPTAVPPPSCGASRRSVRPVPRTSGARSGTRPESRWRTARDRRVALPPPRLNHRSSRPVPEPVRGTSVRPRQIAVGCGRREHTGGPLDEGAPSSGQAKPPALPAAGPDGRVGARHGDDAVCEPAHRSEAAP